MLQLFQTEWCAASRRVRQRLTELGVDYVVRQVPADRRKRTSLVAATGADSVPALLLDNGSAVVGEDSIGTYLDEHYLEPSGARWHRARAEKARRRYLEQECECAKLVTR
jgi:glutathione S-transferase